MQPNGHLIVDMTINIICIFYLVIWSNLIILISFCKVLKFLPFVFYKLKEYTSLAFNLIL